jgi:hypothetical protein
MAIVEGSLAPTTAETPPGPPPKPKLRRAERRDDPGRWATVIPPALAEQVADSDALKAHRKLVERVEQGTRKVRELEAAHVQAVEQDRQAEADFAAGKARKLAAPVGPDAGQAVGQARRELELLERELPRSAGGVFDAAHPFLDRAAAQLERALDEDDERVEAAIGEALRVLDERSQLAREAHWIELAMWESLVSPYDRRTPARASSAVATGLREALNGLRVEREEEERKRFERAVELQMLFNDDRSPKRPDGRSKSERRREAEQIVREREAAGPADESEVRR